MRRRFGPILLAGALLAQPAGMRADKGSGEEARLPPAPVNLDFEEGEIGKVPVGWSVPAAAEAAGFGAELTTERPAQGQRCAVLRSVVESRSPATGALVQAFDAAAYRGRRVRFRAAVRTAGQGPSTQARLALAVERRGAAPGFMDRMDDRPISSADWRTYEVVGDVVADAERIELGLLLSGGGQAWIDAASFEVLGPAGAGSAAARPLTPRGLDNLVALTRLLGYVRYFHPSDQAAAADWPNFAAAAVETVEPAAGAGELAAALERLFQPIAPTLRVFVTGEPSPAGPAPLPRTKLYDSSVREGGGVPREPFQVSGSPQAMGAQTRAEQGGEAPVVIAWRYEAFATGGRRTEGRRVRSSEVDRAADPLPDPRTPLLAELGGGVSCQLPLALYADRAGTLPHLARSGASAARPRADYAPSGHDRTTRLVDVAFAWDAIAHFYPYFDGIRDSWPAVLRETLGRAAVDSDELGFLHTLRRLIAHLDDGQGRAVLAGDNRVFEPPLRWDWVEGQLVVTQLASGAPPELSRGDVVVKIGGRAAAEALAAAEDEVSAATPQWRRWRALSELAMGAQGEPLRIEVRTHAADGAHAAHAADSANRSGSAQAGTPSTFTLLRSVSPINPDAAFNPPEKVREPVPGVIVVDLTRSDDRDLAAALPRLAKARGIVFDLRGYPRVSKVLLAHLLTRPAAAAPLLAPVVLRPDHEGVQHRNVGWSVEPIAPRLTAKLVFLTNGHAISRAESYLDLVAREHLGTIVGSATAGTNGDVATLSLPGGYTLIWTGLESRRSDGSPLHGRGIQPDLSASPTLAAVAQGGDAALERAIEVASRGPS